MTVLGTLSPDPMSLILGTGYSRFSSPTGIEGLAKTRGRRLDVLAVNATKPRTGQLRSFIQQAKAEFADIYLWEIMEPLMDVILIRYGFTLCAEMQPDGEVLLGYHFHAEG